MNKNGFWQSGDWRTLLVSFLYFEFCFAVWVLNGAMAPSIGEELNLDTAAAGLMVAVPIVSGALLRFPLGIMAQRLGLRQAAIINMVAVMAVLAWGALAVNSYLEVLVMGAFLGLAGASFSIALALGSGSFSPRWKGTAAAVTALGNSGAIIAILAAPPLAAAVGWQRVYGLAILPLLLPLALMLLLAKEPAGGLAPGSGSSLRLLANRDAWVLNLAYMAGFGGFIGFTSFLPLLFNIQYGIEIGSAGSYPALIILMACLLRLAGGWAGDRFGGVITLRWSFILALPAAIFAGLLPGAGMMTVLLMVLFAALGAASGATFQVVPLQFPEKTAAAMGLVGMVGALGGAAIPLVMAWSVDSTGSFGAGFFLFAGLLLVALAGLNKKITGF